MRMEAKPMSRTLSLVDHLRQRGRSLHRLGCKAEALAAWNRLAELQELPEDAASEMHEHVAELAYALGRFEEARRRIRAVLMRSPNHPYWHFLLAQCIERDPKRDRRLALRHYQQAVKNDPEQADYWAHLARCADECGDAELAEGAASHALELDPARFEVVEPVVSMRCKRGDFAGAREALRMAMFRNPSERRFGERLERVRFEEAQHVQKEQQGDTVLPFVVSIKHLRDRHQRRDSQHLRPPMHPPILRLWTE
jgi:tetratricopeptide (TPR) repeat protein